MKSSIILLGFGFVFLSYFSVNSLELLETSAQSSDNDKIFKIYGEVISMVLNILLKLIPDPVSNKNLPMNFDAGNPLVSGTINIKDLDISGIHRIKTDTNVTGVCYTLISLLICIPRRLTMDITVPDFSFNCSHDENVKLIEEVFPFWGSGNLSFHTNLTLSIDINFTLDPVVLDGLLIAYNMESLDFSLTGLLNNTQFSQDVEKFINQDIVPLLEKDSKLIGRILSGLIKELINNWLNELSGVAKYIVVTFLTSLGNN